MDIIYFNPFFDAEPWIKGIQKRLPEAKVRDWQEGDNDAADYALVWKPPHQMLAKRNGLKAIFALGAGVDAILEQEQDRPGTLPAGVPLIRLQDAGMARQMEEYALAAALRYFRRFDDYQLQQSIESWEYLEPYSYQEFVIGVMGLGVLGRNVAQRLADFGFIVKGWSNHKKVIANVMTYDGSQLDKFLNKTRLIINLLPNTPQTSGILNKTLFDQLEKGSFLINIARGAHLIEQDCLDALACGQLTAVTLDVFKQEPLPKAHAFWQNPKVTITPHIAAMTLPDAAMDQICEKIRVMEKGERVTGKVDLAKGY